MKTFDQRLLDYVTTHPEYNASTVYDQVLDKHKRAIWKMQHRIKERIEFMLTSNESAFFITFTFSDEYLPISTEEYLTQQYVFDCLLANQVSSFVANTDYGKENGRFHWHAVVQSQHDIKHELWKYGSIHFQRIPKTSLPLKLSRYLIKLQRHATKILDPFMIYYPMRYRKGGE